MDAKKRLVALLTAGAVAIGSAWYAVKEHPSQVNSVLRNLEHITQNSPSEAYRITRDQNERIDQPIEFSMEGIPDAYRYSQANLDKYQGWVHDTVSHEGYALVADKLAGELQVYKDGQRINTFKMDLGTNPIGDKFLEHDRATPEGQYFIDEVRDVGQTGFYRGYVIDYPQQQDLEELADMKEKGLVKSGHDAGNLIMVHGKGGSGSNWTWGCMALSNQDMDTLFSYDLQKGTPITIVRYGTKEQY